MNRGAGWRSWTRRVTFPHEVGGGCGGDKGGLWGVWLDSPEQKKNTFLEGPRVPHWLITHSKSETAGTGGRLDRWDKREEKKCMKNTRKSQLEPWQKRYPFLLLHVLSFIPGSVRCSQILHTHTSTRRSIQTIPPHLLVLSLHIVCIDIRPNPEPSWGPACSTSPHTVGIHPHTPPHTQTHTNN